MLIIKESTKQAACNTLHNVKIVAREEYRL